MIECISFTLAKYNQCHAEISDTTWGRDEGLRIRTTKTTPGISPYIRQREDLSYVLQIMRPVIVGLAWGQTVFSPTNQKIAILMRSQHFFLERELCANKTELLSASMNLGFESLPGFPADFTIEIRHLEPITFLEHSFLDLTVLASA